MPPESAFGHFPERLMRIRPCENLLLGQQRQARTIPHSPYFGEQLSQGGTARKTTQAFVKRVVNANPCLSGGIADGTERCVWPLPRAFAVSIGPSKNLVLGQRRKCGWILYSPFFGKQLSQRGTAWKAPKADSQSIVHVSPFFPTVFAGGPRGRSRPLSRPFKVRIRPGENLDLGELRQQLDFVFHVP